MKIITYNVNGIRSALDKGFLQWLQGANPDVLCLQEGKAEQNQINVDDFKALGYEYVYWHSAQKKGYSGVAIFSGLPFTSINPTALSYGGNRASTSAWREDGNTGNWFFGRVDPNATTGTITTSTNGGITWTSGYAYVASFVYQSAV